MFDFEVKIAKNKDELRAFRKYMLYQIKKESKKILDKNGDI